MSIYVLFSNNLSAKSGLAAPFSPAWGRFDSINWGIERQIALSRETGITASAANIREIQLTKRLDGLSVGLVKLHLVGSYLASVLIAFTEGTTNKTILAFKLANVYISLTHLAGDSGGSASEEISLFPRQLAMAVLTAGTMDMASWDLAANSQWTVPTGSFTLDPTLGIKVA